MAYISYLLFRIFVFLFSLFSHSLVYSFADLLAFIFRYIVRYRLVTVKNQLRFAFPNKTSQELHKITTSFYKNLADIIVESIKGMSMQKDEFRKRYVFVNPEVSDQIRSNGQNVIHAASHYANWEWGAMTYPLWVKGSVYGFYKPLSNKYIEKYVYHQRSKFGMNLISINETNRTFDKNKNEYATYVMVSDQYTHSAQAHHVQFFGRETTCTQGLGKYAMSHNCKIVFVIINRTKRGHYEVVFEKLEGLEDCITPEEITSLYMSRLEKLIISNPKDWLWSHKRWKNDSLP